MPPGFSRSRMLPAIVTISVLLLLLSPNTSRLASAYQNGENASTVIGQYNFTSDNAPANASGLNVPSTVAFDPSGNMWVADTDNYRLLEYGAPFSSGENASVQINTVQPAEAIFDRSGDLWTLSEFNVIHEWKPPFRGGMNYSFTFASGNTSQSDFSAGSFAIDPSGNIWIVDEFSNRVLEFKPPFTSGEDASIVIGQPNFTSLTSSRSQSGVNGPGWATFDASGDLWLADSSNSRILEYVPPFTNGENASVVIGQRNFTSFLEGPTQSIIDGPSAVAIDPQGNLWVVSVNDARVLEFTKPFTNDENASVVIGQADFCSAVTANNPSQSNTYIPGAMAFDRSGNLWLADSGFNRVLEFQNLNSATRATSTSTCTPRVSTYHSPPTTTGGSTPSEGPPISPNEEFAILVVAVATVASVIAVVGSRMRRKSTRRRRR